MNASIKNKFWSSTYQLVKEILQEDDNGISLLTRDQLGRRDVHFRQVCEHLIWTTFEWLKQLFSFWEYENEDIVWKISVANGCIHKHHCISWCFLYKWATDQTRLKREIFIKTRKLSFLLNSQWSVKKVSRWFL